MVKPGSLLLLLAVAASFRLSQAENLDISSCPITYFGKEYTKINVDVEGGGNICFLDDLSLITEDCIYVSMALSSNLEKFDRTETISLTGDVPGITTDSTCHTELKFSSPSDHVTLILYKAGTSAAVKMFSDLSPGLVPSSISVSALVGDRDMGGMDLSSSALSTGEFMDISGCRHDGSAYVSGDSSNEDLCSDASCIVDTGEVTLTPRCGDGERCVDGSCFTIKEVCTVTGSSIIDFNNNNRKVPDRCAYTLVKPTSGFSYELVAVFKERRRKDVSFLDHLILKVPGTKIYVEQGGRVLVDGSTLSLTDQFDTHHGVEIRKVDNEIIFKIPGTSMEVVYDGYSAHVSGLTDTEANGLCGNPSDGSYNPTLSDLQSSESDTDCSAPETDDSTDPDCALITPHCELMTQGSFDICSGDIDSTPYVTACKDVLCHYPDVDGHKCQFFEAYAKSCKLSYGTTIDLNSVAGCSSDPHPCHDQYCADDEFCGDKVDGTRCFCRALFAAQYPNGLGPEPDCKVDSAILTLPNCLLEDKGIDHTTLQLSDVDCPGDFDTVAHLVTFEFDYTANTCGMTPTEADGVKTYANVVKTKDFSSETIIRHDPVTIDFSCRYTTPTTDQVTLKIMDSTVTEVITAGEFSYTLTMSAYTDRQHSKAIDENTDLHLDQKIYVTIVTTNLDSSEVALFTKSCTAASSEASNSDSPYDLISEGCADDSTVVVEGNGFGTSNSFSFNLFQFQGKTGKIILTCEVELCVIAEGGCLPDCTSGTKRKRRSFRSKYDRNLALISMSWND